jgi:hypothetical protein
MKSRRVSAKSGKVWMFSNEPLGGSPEVNLSSKAAKVVVVLPQDLLRSSLYTSLVSSQKLERYASTAESLYF